MKTIKNLMLGIGLAGSLALGNKAYSQENKVYNDFIEFVKSKDNREGLRAIWDGEIIYTYESFDLRAVVTSKQISLEMRSKDNLLEIIDRGANGLILEEKDDYEAYELKNGSLVLYKKLQRENELEIDSLYTNGLKRVMHDEKYKEY